MPEITTMAATATVKVPARYSPRRDTSGDPISGGMLFSNRRGCELLTSCVKDAEDHRYEHQRCNGSADNSPVPGADKRSVLLAAFDEAKRHRQHADDHRQRRHQNRPEADKA